MPPLPWVSPHPLPIWAPPPLTTSPPAPPTWVSPLCPSRPGCPLPRWCPPWVPLAPWVSPPGASRPMSVPPGCPSPRGCPAPAGSAAQAGPGWGAPGGPRFCAPSAVAAPCGPLSGAVLDWGHQGHPHPGTPAQEPPKSGTRDLGTQRPSHTHTHTPPHHAGDTGNVTSRDPRDTGDTPPQGVTRTPGTPRCRERVTQRLGTPHLHPGRLWEHQSCGIWGHQGTSGRGWMCPGAPPAPPCARPYRGCPDR